MSVKNGQVADENTFNDGYLDKNEDTTTVNKISLHSDDVADGAHIESVQKAVNKSFDTTGIADEGDVNAKVYATNNYITDGDNRKVAIEALDVQAKANADEIIVNAGLIGDNATNLTNHEDAYKQHIEEDTFANLTTFATTAVNGIMCFASDTKQYFFVKDTELVPLGGGGNTYKSTWDAATNTPTLPTGADNNGDYYIVSVAGSQDLGNGLVDWDVNDFALFNDVTGFEKIDNTNKVESVNGKEGIVVLDADDIASTATRYWDIKHNRTAIAEPTVGDDDTLNYSVGSRWLIPADEVELICLDATTGAAVWEQISGSGAGKLSIWGSVKAESNKLKNWTTVGTGTLVVQEVEIASGKSSYELGINALGDGAIYETTATSGAIDVITNGLQYIYKTALTNMLVEILDGNDDSVMEDFVMDEHTDWQYIKELFNFANTFVGPTIKIKMTSTDATTGVVFFDQLELDSDPNTMGNAVESTSSRLSSGGTPSLNVAIPVFTNLGSNLDNEFYTIVSDGTDGTSITFKTSCLVSMSYQDSFLSGTYMGFSKNSVNLSTGFFQIPQSEKITGTYQGTSTTLATATISDYPVVAGDVIRPHADNVNSYNAGEQRILNITATANHKMTYFEGKSIDTDSIWFNVSSAGILGESKYSGNNGVTSVLASTGTYTIDYTSLNLTVLPSFAPSITNTSSRVINVSNVTLTTATVTTNSSTSGALDSRDFSLTINKNGADVKGIQSFATPANAVGQYQEHILAADQIGIGDLATFNVEIGSLYIVCGQADCTNNSVILFDDGGFIHNEVNAPTSSANKEAVSFLFTAQTTTLVVKNSIATTIRGDGTKGETYFQLTKLPEGNYITDVPLVNANTNGIPYRTNEQVNGEWVWAVSAYDNLGAIVLNIPATSRPIAPHINYALTVWSVQIFLIGTNYVQYSWSDVTGNVTSSASGGYSRSASTLVTLKYLK